MDEDDYENCFPPGGFICLVLAVAILGAIYLIFGR